MKFAVRVAGNVIRVHVCSMPDALLLRLVLHLQGQRCHNVAKKEQGILDFVRGAPDSLMLQEGDPESQQSLSSTGRAIQGGRDLIEGLIPKNPFLPSS